MLKRGKNILGVCVCGGGEVSKARAQKSTKHLLDIVESTILSKPKIYIRLQSEARVEK